jgi:hypothetical protein
MRTLALDIDTWDLVKDSHGNIAVADVPYALAQDAASAIKLFAGELWYDTTKGIPYFDAVFGQAPALENIRGLLVGAALTVPGVARAVVYFSDFTGRTLTGQVQITAADGTVSAASFGVGR